MRQNKNTWFSIVRSGLDRTDDFQKLLRISTGSNSILSDQDWTRIEKLHSPLISAARTDHKSAALSTPQICLQQFEMKKACFVLGLFKDIRINKASWQSQSNSYKLKKVLFLIVDDESYFFCLSPPLRLLFYLFLLPLHMHSLSWHAGLKKG